ncbi:MAG: hypothetical protein KTR22_12295 [Flavobacteriaceae bacterium]|nr:hypothetical protein [Flavobacteriaceae bacterium]
MNFKQLTVGLLCAFLIYSCGSDDSGNTPQDDQTLDQQQEETVETLTNNEPSQTWKITNASLTNGNGTFDVSSLFNILDDEFIFSENGSLEWRPGHDINLTASSSEEAKLDYYRSPTSSNYVFETDSGNALTALGGSFAFTVNDNGTISGVLTFATGETLALTLALKTEGDFDTPPSSGLVFTEVNTFQSIMTVGGSLGMTGSNATNSLYIATREDSEGTSEGNPEKIFKLSLDTNTFEENLFFQSDFVTKRPYIYNGELVVFGSQYVNTYDQVLLGTPQTVLVEPYPDNAVYSRFGVAVQDDVVYLAGGDIPNTTEPITHYIRTFDNVTGSFSDVLELPENRFLTGAAIVNDQFYVIGGQTGFYNDDYVPSYYVIDLNTLQINTYDLPRGFHDTYAARQGNLIYFAGQIRDDIDGDDVADVYDGYFGVLDTTTNTITDLSHDLDFSDDFSTIYGLTIFNDVLYVIYGDAAQGSDPVPTWSIMAADLN